MLDLFTRQEKKRHSTTTTTLTCYLIFRQSVFRLQANKNTALETELLAAALADID
jgi:hypothetical protein